MSIVYRWLDAPKYTTEQVRGLAAGAIYLAIETRDGPTADHCDDLDYNSTFRIANRSVLKRSWGVRGHDDAMATMTALLDGMHGPQLDQLISRVLPAVGAPQEHRHEFLRALRSEHGFGGSAVAGEAIAALALPQMPSPLPPSTYAWDVVRLAMLARRTVAAGWTTPDEVLPLVVEGAVRARNTFADWREFGNSFVVGRAMWCCDEGSGAVAKSLDQTVPAVNSLLTELSSPWIRLPW
ncbi:hypothetical protein GOEFS_050_00640 [Gordonia effusa NBRC 100432]|uniref:DUF1266 domain-containing protein n=1 Tax=Gordonia effusa NBRC 100432 TaxID=1077974 RepID=H0QZN5_9ACTN|nr:DUF1266 domain-containing protein [Gordonia effusa]GAB18286.1 hypothetical protein GOEFS_050_00640 [Gordonia effusa NBRC 100432]